MVVFGSLNFDHVITVESLPRPGETVSGQSYLTVPGGKGLNQAVTASRQGARVTMVGCVGDDAPGQRLLEVLSGEGIGTGWSRVVPGVASGTALVTVARDGANTVVVSAGANGELSVEEVEAAEPLLGPGTVALAQLEVPMASVRAALSLARARRAVTVLNPAPAPGPLTPAIWSLVDVLVPNEGEALAISGRSTTEDAAAWFLAEGCPAVVITLGERGALVAEGRRPPVVVPAFAVEPVDTTAAGDAFCGALTAALAAGHGLLEAARRGCAAGPWPPPSWALYPACPPPPRSKRSWLGHRGLGLAPDARHFCHMPMAEWAGCSTGGRGVNETASGSPVAAEQGGGGVCRPSAIGCAVRAGSGRADRSATSLSRRAPRATSPG